MTDGRAKADRKGEEARRQELHEECNQLFNSLDEPQRYLGPSYGKQLPTSSGTSRISKGLINLGQQTRNTSNAPK